MSDSNTRNVKFPGVVRPYELSHLEESNESPRAELDTDFNFYSDPLLYSRDETPSAFPPLNLPAPGFGRDLSRGLPAASPAFSLANFGSPSFSDHGTPGTMRGTPATYMVSSYDSFDNQPYPQPSMMDTVPESGETTIPLATGQSSLVRIRSLQLRTLRLQCGGSEDSYEGEEFTGVGLSSLPYDDPDVEITISAIVFGLQSAGFAIRKSYAKSQLRPYKSNAEQFSKTSNQIQDNYNTCLKMVYNKKIGDDLAIEGLQKVLRYVDICQAFCQTTLVSVFKLDLLEDTQKILTFISETVETTVSSILLRLHQRTNPDLPSLNFSLRSSKYPQLPSRYCSYAQITQVLALEDSDSSFISCPACHWKLDSDSSKVPIHVQGSEQFISMPGSSDMKHVKLPHTSDKFLLKSHLFISGDVTITAKDQYRCVLCIGQHKTDTFKTLEDLVHHIESHHSAIEVLLELDFTLLESKYDQG